MCISIKTKEKQYYLQQTTWAVICRLNGGLSANGKEEKMHRMIHAINYFTTKAGHGTDNLNQPIRLPYFRSNTFASIGPNSFLNESPRAQSSGVLYFHYAKDSGNFGRKSNGMVCFDFFSPQYAVSPLEVVDIFRSECSVRNSPFHF